MHHYTHMTRPTRYVLPFTGTERMHERVTTHERVHTVYGRLSYGREWKCTGMKMHGYESARVWKRPGMNMNGYETSSILWNMFQNGTYFRTARNIRIVYKSSLTASLWIQNN